jgi:hypothetical protein
MKKEINWKIKKNGKQWRSIDYYTHAIALVVMDFFDVQPVSCFYISPEFSFTSPLNKKKEIEFDFFEREGNTNPSKDFWEVFTLPLKELSKKKKTHRYKELVVLREKMKLEPVVYEIKEVTKKKKA